MATALYTHPDMLDHAPGRNHAERPERLSAVLGALKASGLHLEPRAAPLITRADLDRVHDPAFVDAMFAIAPAEGLVRIDADTAISPGSLTAARRAAGAVAEAVRAVARGEIDRAFCAVRPP